MPSPVTPNWFHTSSALMLAMPHSTALTSLRSLPLIGSSSSYSRVGHRDWTVVEVRRASSTSAWSPASTRIALVRPVGLVAAPASSSSARAPRPGWLGGGRQGVVHGLAALVPVLDLAGGGEVGLVEAHPEAASPFCSSCWASLGLILSAGDPAAGRRADGPRMRAPRLRPRGPPAGGATTRRRTARRARADDVELIRRVLPERWAPGVSSGRYPEATLGRADPGVHNANRWAIRGRSGRTAPCMQRGVTRWDA